jgi:alpha-L-fucosidase
MAKELGVKYVCLTTKHHEGFCLWPSKYTDFDIESTPYKKDLLKEFVDAYDAAGIDVHLYYSVLDWYHPDWRTDIKNEEDEKAFERFKSFTQNQLVELLERYPTVKGLWFDGTWDKSWKKNGKFSYELEVLLKKKSPGLIVNSRLRADDLGKRHFDSNGDLMGDIESGYERRLPDARDTKVTKRDWECCMTVPENQWGYHKDWSISHVKSSNELIEMLVQSVSQGGNFLLNFGPKGDGSFREEEKQLVAEIGPWMKTNGQAIYGCGYAGLKKMDWGYYTRNDKTGKIYMVVCNVPVSGWLKVKLPSKKKIAAATLLKDGAILGVDKYDSDEFFVVLKDKTGGRPFVIAIDLE